MLSTMLTTDEILPIHPRSSLDWAEQNDALCNFSKSPVSAAQSPAIVMPGSSRSVGFSQNLVTIVDGVDDLEKSESIWYTKKELRSFRSSAKAMADRIRTRQPSLVKEIANAYQLAKKQAGSGETCISSTKLFNKWSKLGSSRRGLERWVFSKQDRAAHIEEVRASRSIVLNLQCLLQRGGGSNQEDMLRQQYAIISKPAVIIAQQMGQVDEVVAKTYHSKTDSEADDEEDFDDEKSVTTAASSVSSESLSSCSSSVYSRISVRSRSGKKLNRRKEDDSLKKKTSPRRRRSTDKSTAAPRRRASKSPLRRLQDSFGSLNRSL